jgi:NitT/TauT family transport system ATP-binding protein
LQDFDAGDLIIDGAPILQAELDRRVVFQSYSLLPWLMAQQDIEFALKAAGHDRSTFPEDRARTASPRQATALRPSLSGRTS